MPVKMMFLVVLKESIMEEKLWLVLPLCLWQLHKLQVPTYKSPRTGKSIQTLMGKDIFTTKRQGNQVGKNRLNC
jgi:hypothetical protein